MIRTLDAPTWLRRLVTHDVETGRSEAYPDLQPLELAVPPGRVFDLALAVARGMEGWTVSVALREEGWIEAEATTPRLGFVDDVTVRVERADDRSRIRVRSASRVGIYDFGANAARIRDYLDRLAAEHGTERRA